jgi:hypothetical protein
VRGGVHEGCWKALSSPHWGRDGRVGRLLVAVRAVADSRRCYEDGRAVTLARSSRLKSR